MVDLTDLDSARARLRISVRPRDRSADNILLATHTNTDVPENPPPTIPKFASPMQRSVSFKRPQEISKGDSFNRPSLKSNKDDNQSNENEIVSNDLSSQNENMNNSTQSMSRSSSQEHIYDNLDVFKRSKPSVNSSSNEDEPSAVPVVKAREHSIPKTRLRPVTMHIPTNNDKQTPNEFENVFNQLKKRGSIRRPRPSEEAPREPTPPPPPPPPPPAPVEEPSPPPQPQPENEPIIAVSKSPEVAPTPPTPNRRKTVGGVHLPANNKVASDEAKPTPSWIDIAKQKQNKL